MEVAKRWVTIGSGRGDEGRVRGGAPLSCVMERGSQSIGGSGIDRVYRELETVYRGTLEVDQG